MKKTAQAYDKKKWPDYDAYQKRRHDKAVELVRKLVEGHYSKQHPWGLKLDNNRFANWDDLHTDIKDDILKHAIIRGGNKIMRQRRGVCHDLVAARMKMLKDRGIDAHRLFVNYGKSVDADSILGHSMVYFSGDDGKLHIASPSMRDRPRKNFGSFDDWNDAVIQYIAALKDSKKLTDDDFVEIHDTTDVPFKDIETWDNYRKKALKGRLLFRQKKAGARDFSGLLKLAALVKKADPKDLTPDQSHPERNRGLNSNNPLLREIYRNIGYVPQGEGTYLYSSQQENDLKRSRKIYNDWLSRPENLGAGLGDPSKPHTVAADWDYKRATGKARPYYIPREKGHAIVLGSYPWSTKEILKHELGHNSDEHNRAITRFWRNFVNDYKRNVLDFERRAWELSGTTESNKIRNLALKSYELQDEYNKHGTVNGKYPGGIFSVQKKIDDHVLPKLYPLLVNNYVNPSELLKQVNTHSVPVIHDYLSALSAAKNGIKFHVEGF